MCALSNDIGVPFLNLSGHFLPQLVPAVTELIVAELLYLQYTDGKRPIYMYINSTGCTRADGETVRFFGQRLLR